MSNYIWDMQNQRGADVDAVWRPDLSDFEMMKTLAGLMTFGSNLPLFAFAYENPEPISFPGPGLSPELAAKAKWLNFYDKDDVLGYPLRPLSDGYAAVVDDDIEIDAGSWGSGLTPISHVAYWTDHSFTKPVAGFLRSLLD
jgi:hypothetical protein